MTYTIFSAMSECRTHVHHDELMPFFCDNRHLKIYYENAVAQGREEDIRPHLELLEKYLGKEVSETEFDCPNSTSNNWTENDWTKRLGRGIQRAFSNHQVTITANLGLEFNSILHLLRVELHQNCSLGIREQPF